MEVSGRIKVVNPEQQVSASFKKRELVVTTEEQYPQHIMIEFTQDKCDLLNNYGVGEPVSINRGRELQVRKGKQKYFHIQGWRIESSCRSTTRTSCADAFCTSFAPAQT
jgi:hypothetical protein